MEKIQKSAKMIASLFIVFGIFSFLMIPIRTQAAFSLLKYFGGKITAMVPCTCSTGDQLTIILGGKSGTYLYIPGKTYARHSVLPGKWTLGAYTSGGTCMVGAEPYCTSLPISKGTISYLGTS